MGMLKGQLRERSDWNRAREEKGRANGSFFGGPAMMQAPGSQQRTDRPASCTLGASGMSEGLRSKDTDNSVHSPGKGLEGSDQGAVMGQRGWEGTAQTGSGRALRQGLLDSELQGGDVQTLLGPHELICPHSSPLGGDFPEATHITVKSWSGIQPRSLWTEAWGALNSSASWLFCIWVWLLLHPHTPKAPCLPGPCG